MATNQKSIQIRWNNLKIGSTDIFPDNFFKSSGNKTYKLRYKNGEETDVRTDLVVFDCIAKLDFCGDRQRQITAGTSIIIFDSDRRSNVLALYWRDKNGKLEQMDISVS